MAVSKDKDTRKKGMHALFFSESKGLWVYRIELPSKSGKRRTKEITAKTQERLLEKIRDPLKQFETHGDLPTGSTKLEAYLEHWYQEIGLKRLRPNTAKGYRSVLWNHVIPEIGNVRLDKLKPGHLRKVYTRITSTPKSAKNPAAGYLTSTYALNAHRVLSTVLKDAEREGLIARNPASLMDAPRKAATELEALTLAEAIQVLRLVVPAFETEPYDPEPMRWATYLLTGARRGEVIGLEWDRVSDVLDLSWQLQRISDVSTAPADYEYRHIVNGMYWVRPKSFRGKRIIPIVEPLKSMLEFHREKSLPNKWGLVFVNANGLPIDPDTESRAWPKALRRSGITDKKVRLHDVRHSTVDLLLEAGVHEDVVMEIVGHSSRAVTRGYKSPHALKRREAAMQQLSTLLGH
jgi:integrase